MPSSTSSSGPTEALAVVESRPATAVNADASRATVQAQFTPIAAAPGEKAAQIDVVTVESRATEFADGTRIQSWTRTEQRVEVIAPERNTVTLDQLALHAPSLGALAGSSETARLLKLDNDDDYTDDDFDDDDDDDDDDDEDLDDEGDPIPPARAALPAAPVVPTATRWNPPFTTIRHGNVTVTVPDIGAIVGQLGELLASAQQHQQTARRALKLIEPLAQQALEIGYQKSPDREALRRLRDEASARSAEPLRQAEAARQAAAVELDHGQRISQRATGSPRVKERLDALIAAANDAQESSLEAARLLRALEEAAR